MTLSYKQISPIKLARRRHFHVIDIRDEHERQDELGFIPGSLFVRNGVMLDELLELIPEEDTVVLSCMGGSRATACIIDQLQNGSERTFYNLDGGLLAWRAAKLPVASFMAEEDALGHASTHSPEEFFVQMRSCFVGEIVEVIVERELDLNPIDLLNTSSHLAQIHLDDTPFEQRLIYFAGYVSWQVGTPLMHIAQNTNWALAHRHFIAEADPSQLTW